MYIIDLTYFQPLSEIEKELQAHREFLDRHFASGEFVGSGPKVPRTGGIILVRDMEREKLDRMLGEDPFFVKKLADYKITEVQFTKKSHLPF